MTNFSNKSTKKKVGILEFLLEEKTNNIVFKFKPTIVGYLKNRNINSRNIIPFENEKSVGQVKKISSDGVVTLILFDEEISVPIDYLEEISLSLHLLKKIQIES